MNGPTAHTVPSDDSESLGMARAYLGWPVELTIERPYGSRHPVHGFRYQANYGYVPGTQAPDDGKLVVVPTGIQLDETQIAAAIEFQESRPLPGIRHGSTGHNRVSCRHT